MSSVLPLNNQLFIQEESYSTEDFYHQVAQYRQLLRSTIVSNAKAKVLLFDNDIRRFLIRLLALGLEEHAVVLPPNDQSGTVDGIAASIDYTAGSVKAEATPSLESEPLAGLCSDTFTWPTTGKLIFFTSGSSGKAKEIVKDWSLINNELDVLVNLFPVKHDAAFIATVSHQHIYGLLFRALLPLKLGNTIYNTFEYPEHIVNTIAHHRHVVLISSPAFLSRLVKDNVLISEKDKFDYLFSSGGKLIDSDAFTLYEQFSQAVVQVYGSTETGGIAHRQVSNSSEVLWQLFPNISCYSEDETKRLVLSSPFIHQETMLLDDIGEVIGDKLKLLGRVDRTVKLEEKRVNLSQMELIANQHPWVEETKLIILEQRRVILAAVVKLNESGLSQLADSGTRFVNQALKEQLLTHFELVTLPRKWRYVEEFPYNTQGKLPVAELENLFV